MITTSEDINSRARSAVVVVVVPAPVILGECERKDRWCGDGDVLASDLNIDCGAEWWLWR